MPTPSSSQPCISLRGRPGVELRQNKMIRGVVTKLVVHRRPILLSVILTVLAIASMKSVFQSSDTNYYDNAITTNSNFDDATDIVWPQHMRKKDGIPSTAEIEELLMRPPQPIPNATIARYSLKKVLKSMGLYRSYFLVVLYDPKEDKFIGYHNKRFNWYRGNTKLILSFKILASSLRALRPDRFHPSQPEFAIALGASDSPNIYGSTCLLRQKYYPCVGNDVSPILQFGSVYRLPLFPSMIAMPMPTANHLHCFHDWLHTPHQSRRACNYFRPKTDDNPNGLTFNGESLQWNELIPQVVWRGTDFKAFVNDVYSNLRQPDFEKDIKPYLDARRHHGDNAVASIQALRDIYDDLLPRWKGVVWTAEAEYEALQQSKASGEKVIPWANIKFSDCILQEGKKSPVQNVDTYQMMNSFGIPAAGEYLSSGDLMNYKYHIDIGGGGGTTWGGTLSKLALPGVLFHHVTITKDYLHEKMQEWVHFIPVKEDLSDLREKFEWAENNPHLAHRISERATMLATRFGTEHGFQELYKQFYENPLLNVIDAYAPHGGKSWEGFMKKIIGNRLEPVIKCGGNSRFLFDCESLIEE